MSSQHHSHDQCFHSLLHVENNFMWDIKRSITVSTNKIKWASFLHILSITCQGMNTAKYLESLKPLPINARTLHLFTETFTNTKICTYIHTYTHNRLLHSIPSTDKQSKLYQLVVHQATCGYPVTKYYFLV